ncbi:hypothetical protein ACHAW6_000290 [Cyclotella cf. meneghiniana]
MYGLPQAGFSPMNCSKNNSTPTATTKAS